MSVFVRLFLLGCFIQPMIAQAQDKGFDDFQELEKEDEFSFDELMNMEVAIVTKREQRISETASAVTVITGEDIRRSGASSIPEVLRQVPGMNVARVNSHDWAVSSRGFNDSFSNKLLVMIDGRSVYSPAFSGVIWHVQDVVLEDIDRIEVVRGPGATVWGANAVNGVINIITKNAKDTQGALISGGAGTEQRGFGTARYGGEINEHTHYRIYGKYRNYDDSALTDGSGAGDSWQMGQGGFRVDWTPSEENHLTFQGDAYVADVNAIVTEFSNMPLSSETGPSSQEWYGVNLLSTWRHVFNSDSDLNFTVYYDHTKHDMSFIEEKRHTLDLDMQQRTRLGERNELIWGLGYRLSDNRVRGSYTADFTRPSRTTDLVSGFIQDEISVIPDKVKLTVGTKLEHNDFTGFELQPSARAVWTPNARNSAWASISRAVRMASQADEDILIHQVLPPGAAHPSLPAVSTISGSEDVDSEKLVAYELGYRVLPVPAFSVDVAGFYNDYEDLSSLEAGMPRPDDPANPSHLILPFRLENKLSGRTYGGELAVNWQPLEQWRLRAAYAYLWMDLEPDSDSTDTTSASAEEQSPNHQFSLRSLVDLPWNLELDTALRYVDRVRIMGGGMATEIPDYWALDVRLGWRPRENLEVAIGGKNLLDDQHPEFKSSIFESALSEIEREVYLKVTWLF